MPASPQTSLIRYLVQPQPHCALVFCFPSRAPIDCIPGQDATGALSPATHLNIFVMSAQMAGNQLSPQQPRVAGPQGTMKERWQAMMIVCPATLK
jgi:hypothetical protein